MRTVYFIATPLPASAPPEDPPYLDGIGEDETVEVTIGRYLAATLRDGVGDDVHYLLHKFSSSGTHVCPLRDVVDLYMQLLYAQRLASVMLSHLPGWHVGVLQAVARPVWLHHFDDTRRLDLLTRGREASSETLYAIQRMFSLTDDEIASYIDPEGDAVDDRPDDGEQLFVPEEWLNNEPD